MLPLIRVKHTNYIDFLKCIRNEKHAKPPQQRNQQTRPLPGDIHIQLSSAEMGSPACSTTRPKVVWAHPECDDQGIILRATSAWDEFLKIRCPLAWTWYINLEIYNTHGTCLDMHVSVSSCMDLIPHAVYVRMCVYIYICTGCEGRWIRKHGGYNTTRRNQAPHH